MRRFSAVNSASTCAGRSALRFDGPRQRIANVKSAADAGQLRRDQRHLDRHHSTTGDSQQTIEGHHLQHGTLARPAMSE